MKKAGKRLGLLALVVSSLALLGVHAQASTPKAPRDSSTSLALAPQYAGASIYRIELSTPTATPVLLVSGGGTAYSVFASSGVSGDFCQGADSTTASGMTLATVGKWITPQVFSSTAVTQCTSQGVCGAWNPVMPVRFENGFVGWKQGSGACYFVIRPD